MLVIATDCVFEMDFVKNDISGITFQDKFTIETDI